jgi:hypothetical protein
MFSEWSRSKSLMCNASRVVRVVLCLICLLCLVLAAPAAAGAQGSAAALVGRAVLPAETLADGPKAGQSLPKTGSVNGIHVPFDSQPVGSIAAMLPGEYENTWVLLTSGVFDSRQNSGDYLLRLYTVELSLRGANGGDGSVSVLDWRNLADPAKKIKQDIKNKDSKARELTGADFYPRALARAKDGTYWVAEAYGPSLLHFSRDGRLMDAPFALGGAGALQGMSILPDGSALVVAQRASGDLITLRAFDPGKRELGGQVAAYKLDNPGNVLGGLTIISNQQAVVIEQDTQQNNKAQFKKVFLADFSANPANKTLRADLLNLSDLNRISTADVFQPPANAFGLGQVFKFPYSDIGAAYPLNERSLIVVNNNHVPFGLGRSASQADDTDFIVIELS